MAEAQQGNFHLSRRTTRYCVEGIFQLIDRDNLTALNQTLESLPHDICTKILNSTIDGCTAMYRAVSCNNLEISKYLFIYYTRQGRREMSDRWKHCRHPLVAAIAVDNRDLIELVAGGLYDINDFIQGPFTPLMLVISKGNVEYVRLMLFLGAELSPPITDYGRSPLMASTEHSKVCRFLISVDADLNQHQEGHTALHTAVLQPDLTSLTLLVNAGANLHIRCHNLTPLMETIVYGNVPAMNFLGDHPGYSEIHKIETLELYNAFLVCQGESVISFWTRALRMRGDNNPKFTSLPPQDVLNLSVEFTTKAELLVIQNDPLSLAFQGILVTERILGRDNILYFRFLLQTALIAHRNNLNAQLWKLLGYIKGYCLGGRAGVIGSCSANMRHLFNEIATGRNLTNPFDACKVILEMMALITEKLWNFYKDRYLECPYSEKHDYAMVIDSTLYMISSINSMALLDSRRDPFYDVVAKLVEKDPRSTNLQSLLHRAIKISNTHEWANVQLIQTLLEVNANVNSRDYFLRTPLMYALKHVPEHRRIEIINLLLQFKCHLDCPNRDGVTAVDFVQWRNLNLYRQPQALQCLAAEVIAEHRVPLEGVMSMKFIDFVYLHKWN